MEKKKDAMVERSLNRDCFICPGCGEEVAVARYRRHQKDHCVNRKSPCKNHYLGCRVMVRPSTRARHEDVEIDAHARSCLYLGGQGLVSVSPSLVTTSTHPLTPYLKFYHYTLQPPFHPSSNTPYQHSPSNTLINPHSPTLLPTPPFNPLVNPHSLTLLSTPPFNPLTTPTL